MIDFYWFIYDELWSHNSLIWLHYSYVMQLLVKHAMFFVSSEWYMFASQVKNLCDSLKNQGSVFNVYFLLVI